MKLKLDRLSSSFDIETYVCGFFYYIIVIDPNWGKKKPLTKDEEEQKERKEREKQKHKILAKQREQQKRNERQRLKQEHTQQREQKRLEEEYKRNFVFCVGCESDNPKGSRVSI